MEQYNGLFSIFTISVIIIVIEYGGTVHVQECWESD